MLFRGMRILWSTDAVSASDERLFPASRHRSARIKKKLIKRYGSEFKMVPVIFRLGNDTLIVHPALRKQFEAASRLLEPVANY